MYTSFIRTCQQLENEKSRHYKPKVKHFEPTSEACNVDNEQELGHDTIRMSCGENEIPHGENEMHEEFEMPCEENKMREEDEMACEENIDAEMEIKKASGAETANINVKKHARGPTRAKKPPLNLENRIEVELYSYKLSSYYGPPVREHVLVTLDERLLSDELKVVLWESIQARFKVDGECKKLPYFNKWGFF